MKPFIVILSATLLLTLANSGTCADSWDVSANYTTNSNPNGAWSYGRKWTVQATAMDLFTVRWGTSGWYLGNAGDGGPSIQAGANMWAKHNGNGAPCARWTCPKSGKYNIRGKYKAADSRGMDSYVYVVVNGAITFSNRIQSYPQSVAFANTVSLNQGDFVDFTVAWGGGVYSEYSWTDVDAVISAILPETPRLEIRVSQVELCWRTAANTWYQLQYRSTLTTNWVPLTGTWITGDGSPYFTTDAVPAQVPQRFYSVVATNSPPF